MSGGYHIEINYRRSGTRYVFSARVLAQAFREF